MVNHYKTLRVKKNATQQEIKDAYRELSKKYHPDKQGGDEKKFKALANAYEVIGDPERRVIYDRTGSDVTENEINGKAGGLLQQLFQLSVSQKGLLAIQKIDMIVEIRENLAKGMNELDKNIEVARKSRKEIGNVLRRVRHENKMNPISLMLKQEIGKHTETIDRSKHEKRVGDRAGKMLTEYGYDFDKEEMRVNHRMGYGIGIMNNMSVTFTGIS